MKKISINSLFLIILIKFSFFITTTQSVDASSFGEAVRYCAGKHHIPLCLQFMRECKTLFTECRSSKSTTCSNYRKLICTAIPTYQNCPRNRGRRSLENGSMEKFFNDDNLMDNFKRSMNMKEKLQKTYGYCQNVEVNDETSSGRMCRGILKQIKLIQNKCSNPDNINLDSCEEFNGELCSAFPHLSYCDKVKKMRYEKERKKIMFSIILQKLLRQNKSSQKTDNSNDSFDKLLNNLSEQMEESDDMMDDDDHKYENSYVKRMLETVM
ncbi:hypothetical protein SNEBB_010976 [Seison nebaliae]|nr:hypothetical protein SNEBB_010976 [Seison nebaliae]